MNNMSIDLTNFNYSEFKAGTIEKIKAGQLTRELANRLSIVAALIDNHP